ncbi:hypothetical protein ES754_00065 [Psychrobacter frigidicola]|uniref:LPS-assembly lipoprotein LptE n=1 Tax=Psychrobacter frigidicola TaxID=45611 RepID=A0A5C7A470_9GAMM|nr:hypothetical protein [Psychrobacter frigidicola]TXD97430.1 hypothetical protein ES754_00065 [Psychrobacter frigidicola]
MGYQDRPTQLLADAKGRVKKLATVLLTALPMLTVVSVATGLSGCGFQLRGYDAPLHFDVAKTALIIEDNRISFPLKLPLTRRLEALGVDVIDNNTANSSTNSATSNTGVEQIATINVKNVRFKRYELVGVLTEIRLVLSAEVTYQTIQEGKSVTLTNPIQVERSYQYNEASVSTDDQQGSQIRDWLYDSLSRRITDQYVAISLPKMSPASTNKSSQLIKNPANKSQVTTIVAPDS